MLRGSPLAIFKHGLEDVFRSESRMCRTFVEPRDTHICICALRHRVTWRDKVFWTVSQILRFRVAELKTSEYCRDDGVRWHWMKEPDHKHEIWEYPVSEWQLRESTTRKKTPWEALATLRTFIMISLIISFNLLHVTLVRYKNDIGLSSQ